MKFLVVDDSVLARQRVKDYLKELQYDVVGEACNGLEAIEQFKLLNPSFVTLDFEMPELNGIEAAQEILRLNSAVSIILITSIEDKKELIDAIKHGVKRVIKKPFTQEQFNRTINELI